MLPYKANKFRSFLSGSDNLGVSSPTTSLINNANNVTKKRNSLYDQLGASTTTFGLELAPDMIAVLEAYCRIVSLGFGNFLDKNLRHRFSLGLEDASVKSVFFTSRPITAGSVKRNLQLAFLVFGAVYVYWFFDALWAGPLRPQPKYEHFLFRNVLKVGGGDAHTPGVSLFGLLGPQGCSPPHSVLGAGQALPIVAVTWEEGTNLYVSYKERVAVRGWWVETGVGMEGSSYFEVYGSNVQNITHSPDAPMPDTWDLLGTPFPRVFHPRLPLTRHQLLGSMIHNTPLLDPPDHFIYDQQLDEIAIMNRCVTHLVKGVGCIVYAILGILGQPRWARYTVAGCWLLCLGAEIASVFMRIASGMAYQAFEIGIMALPEMFVCLAFVHERYAFVYFILYGLADTFVRILDNALSGLHLLDDYSKLGTTILCLMVLMAILRWSALRESRTWVKGDQDRYDALWREEVEKDSDAGLLQHLQKVVRMLGILPTDSCRHCNRMKAMDLKGFHRMSAATRVQPPDPLFDSIGHDYLLVPGTLDHRSLLDSIDQSYAQAAICNVLLKRKIQTYAAASNGYFPLKCNIDDKTVVSWKDAEKDPMLLNCIRWPTLKKHRRAIEKLLRSYENDVSQLVDVSRHTILFETVSDLTLCLGQIATDEQIVIQRIKNRFSQTYDSAQTAGYRDVAVNFRITTPESWAIGSETHICELQLQLITFWEQRSSEGHSRYVSFRNSRGT